MKESFDLLIRGGTVATPNGIAPADVGVIAGRIAAIGRFPDAKAAEVFDAKGLHVLPGVMDTQVHFREPGNSHKEDLASGSLAAILGGVTAVFEMPNTNPPTTNRAAIEDKLARAKGRMHCDHAFYAGATPQNIGALAELAYSHPIGKPVGTGHLGLTIGIRARINGIDKDANTQPLKAIFPQYEWSVTNSHWKSFSAMGGIYYVFPASSKVDIRTELDLGIARSYLPAMTILGILDTAHTGATDLVQASVNKAHATSFSGALKAGVVYHLNKRLNIVANLDFWYLEPTFKITQNVVVASHLIVPGNLSLSNAQSISVQTNTRNYDQAMNTLNLTVGVAYNF